MNSLQQTYSNIDFTAYLDMDISEVQDKINEINDAIDELSDKQIQLDMEWDTTDIIESGMKKIGSFAKMLENDTKKVGDSYQMTAA
jgi:hypothetical protein